MARQYFCNEMGGCEGTYRVKREGVAEPMVKRIELKVEDGIVECDCKGQDPSTSHISCTPLEFKYPCGTHPSVPNTYGGSRANLRAIRHTSPAPPPPRPLARCGGTRKRIIGHAMSSSPATNPAFARAATAKPRRGSVLLSMIGCTTAPREEPAATSVIASARRRWKY